MGDTPSPKDIDRSMDELKEARRIAEKEHNRFSVNAGIGSNKAVLPPSDYEQLIDSLGSDLDRVTAERDALREGLTNALEGFDITLNLLHEHPVLKGHADKVRQIYQRIDVATKALEERN